MAVAVRAAATRIQAAEPFEPLEIAVERCKGCRLCVDVCPKHILALDESIVNELGYHAVHVTDPELCTSCALCARICPDAVYTVYARPRVP